MDNKSLELIRQKFLKKLHGLIPVFGEFFDKIKREIPPHEELTNIRISVHQIAGSAKTFGFAGTSKFAANVEHFIDMLLGEADKQEQSDEAITKALHQSLGILISHSGQLLSAEMRDVADEPVIEPQKSSLPKKNAPQYKVLIGDDDTLVIDLISLNLGNKNCEIIAVPDGHEVVLQAKLHQPDLIIQDVNMPEISGFDILKKLKETEETKNIPVMMLTKRNEDKSVIEGITSGAADYIIKPFDIDKLVKRVLMVLGRRRTTVMVADDDEIIYELLSLRFRKQGYKFVVAKNGREALEKIQLEKPDIILLDIMMPGINGMAVLNQIRQDMKSDVPVVMLTAKNQVENSIKSFEQGAHDYVTKPFDVDELMARITAILKRQAAKMEAQAEESEPDKAKESA